jgi:hypothetical protein
LVSNASGCIERERLHRFAASGCIERERLHR